MKLAAETVSITLDDEVLHLRPTLRAATRLHRLHGSFDVIVRGIAEVNASVMLSVIRETGDAPGAAAWLTSLDAVPLAEFAETLQAPLLSTVLGLVGVDEEALALTPEAEPESIEPTDFEEHFGRLFRIATGWLGWTPAEAWDATPAEIVEAYKGRVELLNAIFGSGEGEASKASPEDKLRAIFSTIGTQRVSE